MEKIKRYLNLSHLLHPLCAQSEFSADSWAVHRRFQPSAHTDPADHSAQKF